MIFRKHGMNPGKSIRWHLNSDKKKKRIKLYRGPGNRKMTRFVSNSYSALYRIYFSKRGKEREKKREQKYLTICTVIRIEHRWLRVARIISHVRNAHARQIDVWFNVHTRNYAHTNRVNVSINVRQTTYESVGLRDSNHFRTDRFFDAIDNLSNNDNYFSTTATTPFSSLAIPATSMDFQYR